MEQQRPVSLHCPPPEQGQQEGRQPLWRGQDGSDVSLFPSTSSHLPIIPSHPSILLFPCKPAPPPHQTGAGQPGEDRERGGHLQLLPGPEELSGEGRQEGAREQGGHAGGEAEEGHEHRGEGSTVCHGEQGGAQAEEPH